MKNGGVNGMKSLKQLKTKIHENGLNAVSLQILIKPYITWFNIHTYISKKSLFIFV